MNKYIFFRYIQNIHLLGNAAAEVDDRSLTGGVNEVLGLVKTLPNTGGCKGSSLVVNSCFVTPTLKFTLKSYI